MCLSPSAQVLWGPSGPRWPCQCCLPLGAVSLLRNVSRKSIKNTKILAQVLEKKRAFQVSPHQAPLPGSQNPAHAMAAAQRIPRDAARGYPPITNTHPQNRPLSTHSQGVWMGTSREGLDWVGCHGARSQGQILPTAHPEPGQGMGLCCRLVPPPPSPHNQPPQYPSSFITWLPHTPAIPEVALSPGIPNPTLYLGYPITLFLGTSGTPYLRYPTP